MEKRANAIQDKCFAFAVRVVKAYKHLVEKKKEFVLSKQLLRSGTSIGANVEEALGAQSTISWRKRLACAVSERNHRLAQPSKRKEI
jgi:four helix bundle protein